MYVYLRIITLGVVLFVLEQVAETNQSHVAPDIAPRLTNLPSPIHTSLPQKVLFIMCAGNELFFVALYLLASANSLPSM